MSEERHSQLAVHPLQVGDSGELLKRGAIVRRTKIGVVLVLVLLGSAAPLALRACSGLPAAGCG